MRAFDILKYFTMSLVALITLADGAAGAEDTPLTEPEQLNAQLDQPQIVILDVRIVSDSRKSDRKITGATRVDPHDVSSWAGDFKKDALVVLYCAGPNEFTSASVALRLREMGYTQAFALKGGWKEWERRKYPTEKK